jgi:hypothetical protein
MNNIIIIRKGTRTYELFAPETILTNIIESVHSEDLRKALQNAPKTMVPVTYRGLSVSETTLLSVLDDLRSDAKTILLGDDICGAWPEDLD